MNGNPKRDYASQADYIESVRDSVTTRTGEIVDALRNAFHAAIRLEQVEVIVFSELSASELADKLLTFPMVVKPLLLVTNLAARAIERDLGIRNVDTYDCQLSRDQAIALGAYMKPFLPPSVPLPALAELDRVMFADKEIRKNKGRWEQTITAALTANSGLLFRKSRFWHNRQQFELDAAAIDPQGHVTHAVDIKRVEARRDIHKRTDEIVNKARHLKAVYPKAKFGAVLYYPFPSDHGNVRDRLQTRYIDSVVFAGVSHDSIESAVRLLLGKFDV